MIQILELIKLLGLGIASLLICTITMADIKNTKDFMKAIDEVRKEYPEESIESKIPSSFIATVAATETGNFQFKNAPTAKQGNNYFGMHATGDQKFLETTGGARLRSFDDSKASIRAFLNLMANDERYKNIKAQYRKRKAYYLLKKVEANNGHSYCENLKQKSINQLAIDKLTLKH